MRLTALVALEGFEPSQAEPESEVLPLHHRAIFFDCKGANLFLSFPTIPSVSLSR